MLVRAVLLLSWLTAQAMGQVEYVADDGCGRGKCDPLGLGSKCYCWPGTPGCSIGTCPHGVRSDPAMTTSPQSVTCPADSYMCEGLMGEELTAGYLNHYFATGAELAPIRTDTLHYMKCKVAGLSESGAPIILNFAVNDITHKHHSGSDDDICLHMQLTSKNPETAAGIMMDTVVFASGDNANLYTYSGEDSGVHYGSTMDIFCSPGTLTSITMCVTPCGAEGVEEAPTPPPVVVTAVPTPGTVDGGLIDNNDTQPDCFTEGRGQMVTLDNTEIGDGGAKDNQCFAGKNCILKGKEGSYGQEFAMFEDVEDGVHDMVCTFTTDDGVYHEVTVTVDKLNDYDYVFNLATDGYLITGGVMKSGSKSGNVVFGWPICGSDPLCCLGTDCESCDDIHYDGSAAAYGGRTDVAISTSFGSYRQGNKVNYGQQAMSHVNLCIDVASDVCPGMGC